jgi:adenylosuccinate synthase
MPGVVLVGAQWGDEGKGKATDLLGSRVDYVVKFNGGNNAGHTVVIDDEKYALHLLPSGILSPGVVPVIANGVVVDIEVLFEELDALIARGVDVSRLLVSGSAHIIAPYHRTIDKVTERFLGKRRIGTTGRGIGPAYADKINRVGIRMWDLFDEKILRAKIEGSLDQKNHLLVKVYNRRAITVDETLDELLQYADRLRPMVTDTAVELNKALDAGKNVLFEAGQATMLDIDHGTYPFVTSSSATAGGAVTGSGVGPTRIDSVIGVIKAYTTRVGEGPFPTELFDDKGEFLRKTGGEYGVTTGRARRTGWYDAVIARYATCSRAWRRSRSAWRTTSTASATTRCLPTRRRSTTRSRSTRSSTAGGRTSPRPAPSRTCRRTPRPTCGRWRRCRAPGSPRSASARSATRSSPSTTSSTAAESVSTQESSPPQ